MPDVHEHLAALKTPQRAASPSSTDAERVAVFQGTEAQFERLWARNPLACEALMRPESDTAPGYLEKAHSLGNLVKKQITDSNGKRTTVYVRANGEEAGSEDRHQVGKPAAKQPAAAAAPQHSADKLHEMAGEAPTHKLLEHLQNLKNPRAQRNIAKAELQSRGVDVDEAIKKLKEPANQVDKHKKAQNSPTTPEKVNTGINQNKPSKAQVAKQQPDVSKMPGAAKGTPKNWAGDESFSQEVRKAYDVNVRSITKTVDKMVNGNDVTAIIYGEGGAGKTYNVLKKLKEEGKKEITLGDDPSTGDYVKITGKITPKAVYEQMYKYRDKLIILDDCDSALRDEDTVNMFKGALDTAAKRMVSRVTPEGAKKPAPKPAAAAKDTSSAELKELTKRVRAGDKTLKPADYDRWAQLKAGKATAAPGAAPAAAEDSGEVPPQFEFKGKILFITNKKPNPVALQPILSRGSAHNATMDRQEILFAMSKNLPFIGVRADENGKAPDVPFAERKEIYDFIKENEHLFPDITMRHFGQVYEDKKFAEREGIDWQEEAKNTLEAQMKEKAEEEHKSKKTKKSFAGEPDFVEKAQPGGKRKQAVTVHGKHGTYQSTRVVGSDKQKPAPKPAAAPRPTLTFTSAFPAQGKLGGVPFAPWADVPTTDEGWAAVAGQNADLHEPAVPELGHKKLGSGVIIQEADGRVWLVKPTKSFGGYRYTFPKGGVEEGLSMQANAIKESWEESGLQVEITGYAGDVERDTSVARYYFAKRVGGTPTDHGWESEAVVLVDPKFLHQYLNKPVDQQLAHEHAGAPTPPPPPPVERSAPLSKAELLLKYGHLLKDYKPSATGKKGGSAGPQLSLFKGFSDELIEKGMASKQHLVLQFVKSKSGAFVKRWVDTSSNQHGPAVPHFSPDHTLGAAASKHAKQIADHANAGAIEELKNLKPDESFNKEEKQVLQDIHKQAVEHTEGHQAAAVVHLAAKAPDVLDFVKKEFWAKPVADNKKLPPLHHFTPVANLSAILKKGALMPSEDHFEEEHKWWKENEGMEHYGKFIYTSVQDKINFGSDEESNAAVITIKAKKLDKPVMAASKQVEGKLHMIMGSVPFTSEYIANVQIAEQDVTPKLLKALAKLGIPVNGTLSTEKPAFAHGVDTAKWKQEHSGAKTAQKKIAHISDLAHAGDLVSLKTMVLPSSPKPNAYQKGVLKAHAAALAHVHAHHEAAPAALKAALVSKPAPAPEPLQALAELAKKLKKAPKPAQAAPAPTGGGAGHIVGDLCRDEHGHFISCALPGAIPVHVGELDTPFVLGLDTSKWKQGHSSVVTAQKKLAAITALANAGDLQGLLATKPSYGAGANNYQKNVMAAHALALAYVQAKHEAKQQQLAHVPELPIPVPGPEAPVVAPKSTKPKKSKAKASDSAPESIDTTAALDPKSTDGWQKVGGQLGSNPGAVMLDENGVKHYVKFSKSNDHARNEVLAARLYELTGVGVVDYQLVSHKPGALGTATTWATTAPLNLAKGSEALSQTQADFAVHAWLSNWDVVGLGFDNLSGIDGKPTVLDTGGALLYRAQGTPKGEQFGATVTEWDTMRSLTHNPNSAAVFGSMTSDQLIASVAKLEALDDKLVFDTILNHGPGTPAQRQLLAAKMVARKHDLVKRKNELLPVEQQPAPAAAPVKPAPDAPTPVAPAFPSPLTEAHLSSVTNPLNQKLWAKKLAIDAAAHGFASGTLTAEQAIEQLQGLTFGVQTYQKKVGTYHAQILAGLHLAAAGAVAAPPAAAGVQPLATPEPITEQAPLPATMIGIDPKQLGKLKAPAWLVTSANEVNALMQKFNTGESSAEQIAGQLQHFHQIDEPTTPAEQLYFNHVQELIHVLEGGPKPVEQTDDAPQAAPQPPTPAQSLQLPPLLKATDVPGVTAGQKLLLSQMDSFVKDFKAGKIEADLAVMLLDKVIGMCSQPGDLPIKQNATKLANVLEQYTAQGYDYKQAEEAFSLAWSGAPGHRKHATPEGPKVPTHLAAPTFTVPVYLSPGQIGNLGPAKKALYQQMQAELTAVATGSKQASAALAVIQSMKIGSSGTLIKFSTMATDALNAHVANTPPDLPLVPTPLPASAQVPVYLSPNQIAKLGAAKKQVYNTIAGELLAVAEGHTTPAAALVAVQLLSAGNSGTLTKFKKMAIDSLMAQSGLSVPATTPAAAAAAPVAKAPKGPKPFDASKLSQPVNFLQWGSTGAPGPSSSIHYNQANHNASRLIYKTAQKGDVKALQELKVMVPNKETGTSQGEVLALQHPSQWVKGYAQQLANEIDQQLNPPKEFRMSSGHPLAALKDGLPAITGPAALTAKKIGYYLLLGSAADALKKNNGGTLPSSEQLLGGAKLSYKAGTITQTTYQAETKEGWSKMPQQQKDAVKSYTGSGYHAINKSLWSGNPSGAAQAAHEGIMTLGHVLKPGTLLSRRIQLTPALITQLSGAVGSVIQEQGISSTTIDPNIWSGNVQLKMTIGPGVKGMYVGTGSLGPHSGISTHAGELEVLLPSNTRMLITKVEPTSGADADGFGGYGTTVVHVVVLPNH